MCMCDNFAVSADPSIREIPKRRAINCCYCCCIVLRYDVSVMASYSIAPVAVAFHFGIVYGTALPTRLSPTVYTTVVIAFIIRTGKGEMDATCADSVNRPPPSGCSNLGCACAQPKSIVSVWGDHLHHVHTSCPYIGAASVDWYYSLRCRQCSSFRLNLFLISISNYHAGVLDAARELAALP